MSAKFYNMLLKQWQTVFDIKNFISENWCNIVYIKDPSDEILEHLIIVNPAAISLIYDELSYAVQYKLISDNVNNILFI